MPTRTRPLAAAAAFLVACSGSGNTTIGPGDTDAGHPPDAHPLGRDSGGSGGDAAKGLDAGSSRADTGATGHTADAGRSADAGAHVDAGGAGSGIDCPTAPCASGDRCCASPGSSQVFACAAACASTADDLGCLKPSDCSGATPTCCATAVLAGTGLVTASTCTARSVTTQCTEKSACTSVVSASCGNTEIVPLCAVAADCVSGTSCCDLTISGSTYSGCVSSGLAMFGGLTCKH